MNKLTAKIADAFEKIKSLNDTLANKDKKPFWDRMGDAVKDSVPAMVAQPIIDQENSKIDEAYHKNKIDNRIAINQHSADLSDGVKRFTTRPHNTSSISMKAAALKEFAGSLLDNVANYRNNKVTNALNSVNEGIKGISAGGLQPADYLTKGLDLASNTGKLFGAVGNHPGYKQMRNFAGIGTGLLSRGANVMRNTAMANEQFRVDNQATTNRSGVVGGGGPLSIANTTNVVPQQQSVVQPMIMRGGFDNYRQPDRNNGGYASQISGAFKAASVNEEKEEKIAVFTTGYTSHINNFIDANVPEMVSGILQGAGENLEYSKDPHVMLQNLEIARQKAHNDLAQGIRNSSTSLVANLTGGPQADPIMQARAHQLVGKNMQEAHQQAMQVLDSKLPDILARRHAMADSASQASAKAEQEQNELNPKAIVGTLSKGMYDNFLESHGMMQDAKLDRERKYLLDLVNASNAGRKIEINHATGGGTP